MGESPATKFFPLKKFVWAPPRGFVSRQNIAPAFDSPRKTFKRLSHPRIGINIKTTLLSGFYVSRMRDGRIELPSTVWKTVILPLN